MKSRHRFHRKNSEDAATPRSPIRNMEISSKLMHINLLPTQQREGAEKGGGMGNHDSGGWEFSTDRRWDRTFGSEEEGVCPTLSPPRTEWKCIAAGGAWGVRVSSDFLTAAVVQPRGARPGNAGERRADGPHLRKPSDSARDNNRCASYAS